MTRPTNPAGDPQAGPPVGWFAPEEPFPPPGNDAPPHPPPYTSAPDPGSSVTWGPPSGPAPWVPTQQWGPPPKPPVLPVVATEYPAFWRAPGIPWWKPVVAVSLGAVGMIVFGVVVVFVGLLVEAAVSGRGFIEVAAELGELTLTPVTFLFNSISLALLVPLAFLLSRLVGQKGGWLSSVVGRIRWRWLMRCFAVSFVAVAAIVVASFSLEGWGSLDLAFRPGWWWLLIGIIVVTPFQAAGEEYLFRGLGNRAVGAIIPGRIAGAVLGAIITSVVFMLIHGAGDIWLNITYFSMGMLWSYLAWRTGGLEAAVAMHTANNIVVLLFLPFQDISDVFDRSAGTGDPAVLIQLVLLGIAGAIIVRMARGASIERSGPPAALDPESHL